MTIEIAVTLAILGLVVATLSLSRVGPDWVLLGGLTLLLVTGVIEPNDALAGFGNEGLITVAVLFIVAEGLSQTGAISFAGQQFLGHPKSLSSAQIRVMLPTAVASSFLNNTPVVAMALPIISDWCRKLRMSVSHLMMPLSYAAILGGLCTLIGTSTTLVVNGLLINERGTGLSMFEIGAVGFPVAVMGLFYILLFSRRLLPERQPAINTCDDPREYAVEMIVEAGSPLVGKSIAEAGLRHLPGMYLMEVDRQGRLITAVSSDERLEANDHLVFVGIVESVVDLRKIPGLKPATDQIFKLVGRPSERRLIEAVVSNSCPYLRSTIRDAKFRTRYNAAVVAVARNGQRVQKKVGDIKLLPGDTLLLETHSSFLSTQRNSRDFFLVSEVANSTPPRYERAWIARLILLAMVLVVSFGFLSMLKAAMLAAGLMLITGCCKGHEAKRAVDWSVLLVIAGGLGIGKAMETSHAAAFIASGVVGAVGNHPWLVLGAVHFVTMVLTNLITAQAAAVLVFPIAMATARGLDVNIMPFVIAIIMAAAASFATPIGYQTNLMVYGPGGYRFNDYVRMGVPLSLLVWLVTVGLTPLIWPF